MLDEIRNIENDIRLRPFMRKIISYDENLYVHSKNVAIISGYIAQQLKLHEITLREIITGALLHDIGKTYIPFSLINKPSYLTTTEFRYVKNHAGYGYELLKDFEFGDTVLDIVLHHHENEIGTGYPHHNTVMHLETKIISVADKYEAIHSHRPYKQGFTHEETMNILCDCELGKYCNVERIKEILTNFNDIRLLERTE